MMANLHLDHAVAAPWRVLGALRLPDVVFLLALCFLAAAGVLALHSAAGGSWTPWAGSQAARFAVSLVLVLAVACVNTRLLLEAAYPVYAVCLAALVAVELFGQVGMGAQRWLNLGFMSIQPSEFAKIGLILAIARYYHFSPTDRAGGLLHGVPALLMIGIPAILVFLQPNLGTSLLLVMAGLTVALLGGLPLWLLGAGVVAAGAAAPMLWMHLHDYQKGRVLTFLNPERDPLGAGYNIIQSKIALGSGGMFGKGFLEGSQSQLGFLPEKHTDFILVVLAEEWGLVGSLSVLLACCVVVAYGYAVAFRAQHVFGRLLALGLTTSFFLYVFVNMAMVMGLIPVVGIPLPLLSNGGTVMMAVMISAGMLLNVSLRPSLNRSGKNNFG
ncbi:rod shape-determining protein RodA [Novispirillum sp. DQ9]|uniref:rod shape-determining protein RodA n=1 Tax=Novispirillum sp. DQ9 TaxID=3398612 RepID=UPI003C7C6E5D